MSFHDLPDGFVVIPLDFEIGYLTVPLGRSYLAMLIY